MNYQFFEQQLTEELQSRMLYGTAINVRNVRRNNQVSVRTIGLDTGDREIVPRMRLDYLYEKYRNGSSIAELAGEVIRRNEMAEEECSLSMESVCDPARIRKDVGLRIVNREKNEELLANMPHRDFLDLAQTLYYRPEIRGCETGISPVYYCDLERWGLSEEELFECAGNNLRKNDPYCLSSMADMLNSCLPAPLSLDPEKEETGISMQVLTSRSRLYGAVYMIYPEVLDRGAAVFGEDIIVIPSSIHELILIPASFGMDREYMEEMVKNINETVLDPSEVLSDHVYYYERAAGRLSL